MTTAQAPMSAAQAAAVAQAQDAAKAAALIAGSMILLMNGIAPRLESPILVVLAGIGFALMLGASFGLAHGLLITKGRIEPFIVTLGTLGIFRAYLTYLADGGAILRSGIAPGREIALDDRVRRRPAFPRGGEHEVDHLDRRLYPCGGGHRVG